MDHRCDIRLPASIDVRLSHRERDLGHFRMRNTSRQGMFIETGPVALCVYDFVEVKLKSVVDSLQSHHLRGLVLHHSNDGVGLLFTADHACLLDDVKQLLSHAA